MKIDTLFFIFLIGIVYTYAGYPLLVYIFARVQSVLQTQPELTAGAELPDITLLVAAYNEEACIAEKLTNSLNLDYPQSKLQILVAADGSTDRTSEIVTEFREQGVELSFSSQRQGKMAALNRAMSLARGEIVVFSDANNQYDSSTIRELVKPFADPKVGLVSGAKVIQRGDGVLGESEGTYWKYESWLKKYETMLGCCTGVAGEAMAIRKELFVPAPSNVINDDFYLMLRTIARGYNVAYAPAARSTERVSLTSQDEVTRRSRIVAGRYQSLLWAPKLLPWHRPRIVWQIISHKYLRPLVPLFMIGAFVSNLLSVALESSPSWWWQLLLAGQCLFYCGAWLGNRYEISGLLGRILYLPTFLVNSNWAALVGLYGYLAGSQTSLWQRAERRI